MINLHVHTLYSALDGVASPEQYIEACATRGIPAIAITEHGNLSSVPDAYFASKKHGVKYIPGVEIYFNDYEPIRQKLLNEGKSLQDIKKDQDLYDRIRRNRHLTVLCKNLIGFKNILELTSKAWDFGYYYKPRIWFEKLCEYKEGLIILSGCLNGPVSHELRYGNNKKAVEYISKFKQEFGDDFYLELQMPCIPDFDDSEIFGKLNLIGSKLNIKKVITNDCHYLDKKDFMTQKLMMAIDQNVDINSDQLFHVNSDEQYFKNKEQLFETLQSHKYRQYVNNKDFSDMCENTLDIMHKCDDLELDISSKAPKIPNANKKLVKLVIDALKEKGLWNNQEKYVVDNKQVTYREQAKIELDRFIDKDFASYFLITRSIVRYCTDNGWPVGPRGSVGGSLVCYLLGITNVDPLAWKGLSFDRFLSASRGGKLLNIKAE